VRLEIELARLVAEQNSRGKPDFRRFASHRKEFLRCARRGRACFKAVKLHCKAIFFRDEREIFVRSLAREVFAPAVASSAAFSDRDEGLRAPQKAP